MKEQIDLLRKSVRVSTNPSGLEGNEEQAVAYIFSSLMIVVVIGR